METKKVRKIVRDRYGKVAKNQSSCCGPTKVTAEEVSKSIGYSSEELDSIPDAANMGLGCGNPTAIASLKEGEVVLDLGAGGGLDCFLAAKKVGIKGKVIGVDMTPDMIDLARDNAEKNNFENVEFRLGEIENLPVANDSVDIIISNCVINLSPEKQRVFDEAFRVLKPGGRITISDIVLLKMLPESLRNNETLLAGCVAGAELKDNYIEIIKNAGFENIEVVEKARTSTELIDSDERKGDPVLVIEGEIIDIEDFGEIKEDVNAIQDSIQSITVTAIKPKKDH
ncbi:MAG: arsenite methyltransferase [Candidatus Heimdallarchaeota archaeon]|nr:arsenite methyltransferase [Candidatus Heimdallarchaeota archaeon]